MADQFTIDYTGPFRENAERLLASVAGKRINYLEIGVLEGRSAVWMHQNILTNRHARYTGIDGYVMSRAKRGDCIKRAKQNLAPFKGKSRFLIGRSEQLLPRLLSEGATYDVIYIDGDHTGIGVAIDTAYSCKLLKPGGIIAVDDMRHPRYRAIRPVVRSILQDMPHKILAENDQLWIQRTA